MMNLNRNEWFFPHPPEVAQQVGWDDKLFSNYASVESIDLFKSKIADLFKVPANNLCLGHGSEDILIKALLYFRSERKHFYVNELSWPTYTAIAAPLGYEIEEVKINIDENKFVFDLNALNTKLQTQKAALIVLASPNNPTGHILDPKDLQNLIELNPKHFFIIDGVYDAPRSEIFKITNQFKNTLYLYSFSKFFGQPGARVGVGFSKFFAEKLHMPLGLSPVSVQTATIAIDFDDYYRSCREHVLALSKDLEQIASEKITVFKTQAPFLLMESVPNLTPSICEDVAKLTGVRPKIFTHHNKTFLRWSLGPSATVGNAIEKYMSLLLKKL